MPLKMKSVILSLLLVTSIHQVQPFVISAISAIYSIYQVVNDAHDTYSKFTTPNTQELMDQIVDLKDDINQVTKEVSRKIDELYAQLITQLPKIGQINRGMEAFARHYNRITYLYDNFERYIRPPKEPNPRALREFATGSLGTSADSVGATLHALHELFIPTELGHLNDGLLMLLAQSLEDSVSADGCDTTPPEEQLYLLYTALLSAELRGFMMVSFTYILLEQISNDTYADELRDTKMLTLTRVQEYMWEIRDVVDWTSRIYYSCDPPDGYTKGSSYFEFEMFLSGYIVNQHSLKPDCSFHCHHYSIGTYALSTRGMQCDDEDKLCQAMEKCNDRVESCYALPTKGTTVCTNLESFPGSRRYSYVQQGNMKSGDNEDCYERNTFHLSNFDRRNANGKIHSCDYCFCLCIDDSTLERYYGFSLRPQVADIQSNKVVAGIKFTKTPHLIHVQIQEGKVQSDSIDSCTLEWKTLDIMEFKKNNDSVPSFFYQNGTEYTEEEDFTRLTHARREIYLDDLVVPEGYVVTGARLNRPLKNDKAIQLEIHATPFDFLNSKLILTDERPSIWITPEDMRDEHDDDYRPYVPGATDWEPAIASFWHIPTVKASTSYSTIEVTISELKGDVSGTVHPVLDIRKVSPSSPFILEGIGLFFKRYPKQNEGLLAFSLRAVNRKKYLDHEITIDESASENAKGQGEQRQQCSRS